MFDHETLYLQTDGEIDIENDEGVYKVTSKNGETYEIKNIYSLYQFMIREMTNHIKEIIFSTKQPKFTHPNKQEKYVLFGDKSFGLHYPNVFLYSNKKSRI